MCVPCWNARAKKLRSRRIWEQAYGVAWALPPSTRPQKLDYIRPAIRGKATGLDGRVGVVMNPPYLGGGKISSRYGNAYLKMLKKRYPGGVGDLAAYFLRAVHIYYDVAYMGVLATNTLSQGATHRLGLQVLCTTPVLSPWDADDAGRMPWLIRRAVKGIPWPGRAKVVVHSIAMCNDAPAELCPMPFYGIAGPEGVVQPAEGPAGWCDQDMNLRLRRALGAESELRGDDTVGVDYTPPVLGLDLVRPIVSLLGDDDVLVDPACGTGALLLYARALGFEGRVIGFDVSEGACAIARETLAGLGEVDIRCADFLLHDGQLCG